MTSSLYYFHMKTKILADFQICISVPLNRASYFLNEHFLKIIYFPFTHSYLNYTNIAWASTYAIKLKK